MATNGKIDKFLQSSKTELGELENLNRLITTKEIEKEKTNKQLPSEQKSWPEWLHK